MPPGVSDLAAVFSLAYGTSWHRCATVLRCNRVAMLVLGRPAA
jgi:hypothetical protein